VPEPRLDPATRVRNRPDVVAERLLDDTVILDPGREVYVRVNLTGRWVWERVSRPQAIGAVAAGLAAEHGLDEAQALADVTAFVRCLLERGLVELVP
jgi:hypothetical protein